jgi:tripeptide aminopeptidase
VSATTVAGLSEVAALMARLCEVESPSGHEGAVAEVVRSELVQMGAEVTEDNAAATIPAGCGNIIGRFPATAPGTPIMFCAHLDTVPNSGPIEVILTDDGRLTNRHPTILGSDNKAAVAAMLVGVRRVLESGAPHAGIELVFTPCEETGLKGAMALDASGLTAEIGFVYDHTGEVGGIITAAPSHSRIWATFVGQPAHAGIVPEAGRSAIVAAAKAIDRMPLGRIDHETTANVGVISGGTAGNVVPARCEVVAEARSRNEATLSAQLMAMMDALTWAASDGECDLECRVATQYIGYRLKDDAREVQIASRALRRVGREPQFIATGGGSDVNALIKNGFAAVNLCNAMTDIHTAEESIAVADLELMVEVTQAIVAESLAE